MARDNAQKITTTVNEAPSSWCVPSIDSQIASEYAELIGDKYALLITRAIQKALEELYERGNKTGRSMAYIWTKHIGISDDGKLVDAWSLAEIAREMSVSRPYVSRLYLEADSTVMRWISSAQNRIIRALIYEG